MKQFILAFLVLLAFCPLQAQPEQGSVVIAARAAQVGGTPFQTRWTYGGVVEYFVSDNVSINYHLSLGENYARIPIGIPLFFGALCYSSFDFDPALFLLFAEGFNVHIPVNRETTIAPYANFGALEYIDDDENLQSLDPFLEDNLYWANDIGVKAHIRLGKFIAIPFGEFNINVGNEQTFTGFTTGISVGFQVH